MATIEDIRLISIDPDVRNGRPCIAGTGLSVTDVVMAHLFHQRTPGEIATDYGISMTEVHAALSYYYQHKDALDRDIREQIETARRYKEQEIGNQGDSILPG